MPHEGDSIVDISIAGMKERQENLLRLKSRAKAAVAAKRTASPGGGRSPRPVRQYKDGPGTLLGERLKAWGISGCMACNQTAKKMDEWGPDKCREEMDTLVAEITPRAKRWMREGSFRSAVAKTLVLFGVEDMATEHVLRHVLEDAISNSKRKIEARSTSVVQIIAQGVAHWREAQTGFVCTLERFGISATVQQCGPISDVEGVVNELNPKVCIVRALPYTAEDFASLAKKHPNVQFVVYCHGVPSHLLNWAGLVSKFASYIDLSRSCGNVWLASPDERVQWKHWTPRALWLPNSIGDMPRATDRPIVGPVNLTMVGRHDMIKNFPNQMFAAALAGKQRKVRLHLMIHGATQRGPAGSVELERLASSLDLDYMVHPHMEHDRHRVRIAGLADICLQASFCESFNYVALEHLVAGIPVVGSPAIRFLPSDMQTDPNDIDGMAERILHWADMLDRRNEETRDRCRAIGDSVSIASNSALTSTLKWMLNDSEALQKLPELPRGVWDDPAPEDTEAHRRFTKEWFK